MDSSVFYSYTSALRHPVIIGRVAGWRLPWAVSATQLGAIAATAVGMLVSRPVWAHLGGVGNLALFCIVVGGVGWAVRHWRLEGRSPLRAAAGFMTVLLAPASRFGVCNGKPMRPQRPVCGHATPVPVMTALERGS